jgi:hypothetical protein
MCDGYGREPFHSMIGTLLSFAATLGLTRHGNDEIAGCFKFG